MKVYICTGIENIKAYKDMVANLSFYDAELTYDWTQHGSVQGESIERYREVAALEAGGVLAADVVVGILPGGRGTHAELGMALGASKPLIILATPDQLLDEKGRTCVFYYHPRVRLAESMQEVLALVKNLPGAMQ